jgi:hypothetical protein
MACRRGCALYSGGPTSRVWYFVKVTGPEALGGSPYAGSLREILPTLHLVGGNMPLHGHLSYLEMGFEVFDFGEAPLLPEPTFREERLVLTRRTSEIGVARESWKASRREDIGSVTARSALRDNRKRPYPGSRDSSAPDDALPDGEPGSHDRYLKSPRGAR